MSKLSEALAAMDKMTPGPWEAIKPVNSNGFWYINNHSTSKGIHSAFYKRLDTLIARAKPEV